MPSTYRSILVAIALGGLASPAAAQILQPAPSAGFGAPPAQQQQQEPPCFKDFSKLRTVTETRAKAVKEAGDRHAPPQEACKLFNSFIAAEAKMIKYIEDNGTWCGIPPQVLTQMKEGHTKASAVRTRVCQLAARGPARPTAPTFSDALGTQVPDASNTKTGRGTYDSLTGSPLAR
jgi:hypothetical protein